MSTGFKSTRYSVVPVGHQCGLMKEMDQEIAAQAISCPQLLVTKRRLMVEWPVI